MIKDLIIEQMKYNKLKYQMNLIIKDYCTSFFHISKYPTVEIIEPIDGKLDPTQFSFDNNCIEVVNNYNPIKEKKFRWLIHEIAHWIFFNKYGQIKGECGGSYPENYVERYAYSQQFKKLKLDGKNLNFIKTIKPDFYEILKVYYDNCDIFIKNPFTDIEITNKL